VIDISSASAGHLVKRIKLDGNALGMTLDAQGSKLFVAEDNADQVAVIDSASNAVVAKIDARARLACWADPRRTTAKTSVPATPAPRPSAVTLSPDGQTLYAVNAGANSVAVIPLRGEHATGSQA